MFKEQFLPLAIIIGGNMSCFFPTILRKSWPYKSLREWSLKGWEPLPRRVVGWNSIRYPVVRWHGKQPHLSHWFWMNTIETVDFSLRDLGNGNRHTHWTIFWKTTGDFPMPCSHKNHSILREITPPRKLTWQWNIQQLKMYFPIENGDLPTSKCHVRVSGVYPNLWGYTAVFFNSEGGDGRIHQVGLLSTSESVTTQNACGPVFCPMLCGRFL